MREWLNVLTESMYKHAIWPTKFTYSFALGVCSFLFQQTHMKVGLSAAHPSHHDIRVHHPTVGRETEAHPSRRTDVHCKCDRTLCSAEVPVEHVRISIPVVEGRSESVPTGEVTQNEGQQSQQTQQRPHRGASTLAEKPACQNNSRTFQVGTTNSIYSRAHILRNRREARAG